MIAPHDAIETEKSDIVWAGFNTDNYVQVGTWYNYVQVESEHEADDDDDDEDDRQERNLPYDTLIYFDNDLLCHYMMPITLFHSLILCRYSVTMQDSYYVPERSEDGKFYTDFQIFRQYVSRESNAGESATLICINSFIHERTVLTKANIMAIQSNFLYCFVYS
jgi:hypothetical protein